MVQQWKRNEYETERPMDCGNIIRNFPRCGAVLQRAEQNGNHDPSDSVDLFCSTADETGVYTIPVSGWSDFPFGNVVFPLSDDEYLHPSRGVCGTLDFCDRARDLFILDHRCGAIRTTEQINLC